MQITDPLQIYRNAKQPKIVYGDAKQTRNHSESDLQLAVCKWLRYQHPKIDFIRHEREGKRSMFMGQLMGKYNSIGGVPDFEILDGAGIWNGLYIEFKKPGEKWLTKNNTVKPAYAHQYYFHVRSWKRMRPAYFCNSLNDAMLIIQRYISGDPLPQQHYEYTDEDKKKYLEGGL